MKVSEPFLAFGIPSSLNPSILINSIDKLDDTSHLLEMLKSQTNASDDTIASWLSMNVKTYRSYRKNTSTFKPDRQEHLIMLLSLAQHGLKVFSDKNAFSTWLQADNFMLGKIPPSDLLNTNSGIRLVDDRLTGLEYGDNA